MRAALYLNEYPNPDTTASHTISGLTPGQRYDVSFPTSGDNRPGDPWVLKLFANGALIDTVDGVDGVGLAGLGAALRSRRRSAPVRSPIRL